MKIKRIIVGQEETNCYVLYEEGHAIVIDPGDEGKRIKHFLSKNELVVDMILLTHAHCDHSLAVDYLYDLYKCAVYVSRLDSYYYSSSKVEGGYGIKAPTLDYPSVFKWGDNEITITMLPGHSEGSVLIHIGEYYFSGDVLFLDGIGRYDLVGSDYDALKESLRILSELKDDVKLYPGHEEVFTIGAVKEKNEYLRNLW